MVYYSALQVDIVDSHLVEENHLYRLKIRGVNQGFFIKNLIK